MSETSPRRFPRIRLPTRLAVISWRDLALTLGPILLLTGLAIWATFWFVQPAPPDTLTITGGPENSTFWNHAEKYKKILARNGVELKILPSQGSLENLRRLIGPMVELIAREDLHPALSDLLIEAAHEVHGGASLLQRAGEFPSPQQHEFSISDDATRYYKSGKGFMYRHLPFWLASLTDRMLVLLVPVLVLLIPGMRIAPWLYRWRIGSRIYRWYGALLGLERELRAHPQPEAREELLKRLDAIEQGVNGIKLPLHFADQFYVLREHITLVRSKINYS